MINFFRQPIFQKYFKLKTGFWLLGILGVFFVGYFFRAYYFLFTYLPFSPYDLYFETSLFGPRASSSLLDLFSSKVLSYPLGYYLTLISRQYLQHFYVIYILSGISFYFLGKEFSGQKIGGLLTFAVFALGYENLIQYTGLTYPSGICYLSFVTALLFYLKYLKSNRDFHLSLFLILGIVTITTYHTGAGAFILTLIGLLVSQLLSPYPIDKKFLASVLFLGGFFCFWLFCFDGKELSLISDAVEKLNWSDLTKFIYPIGALLFLIPLSLIKIKDKYLIGIFLIFATILILLPLDFFNFLISLGPENYFASSPTINAVLSQIILLHLYFILLKNKLIFSQEKKWQFIRGWLIGIFLVFVFLSLENYYVRVLDYSFPLAFVLFAFYWTDNNITKKFKITVISVTLLILIASQFVIFNDNFTLRRFYTLQEFQSAQKIFNLKIQGVFATDLRTSALLNHLGIKYIFFFGNKDFEHETLFYEPQNIPLYDFDSFYEEPTDHPIPDFYVVLSKNMQQVVYSTNFQTKPIGPELFSYYDKHYPKVYDDGLFKVYLIYDNPLNDKFYENCHNL
ncbi:MAG: hypothetical protein WCX70_00660 [Candidatus Paceibacterota bacterium]|jgi:hypothetical protein